MDSNRVYKESNKIKVYRRIDNLFEDYSKVLAIRLDFSIRKDFAQNISHKDMVNYFEKLRNNMRNNHLFDHYITYISKLEYGTEKSWHYHVILFFDGNNVNHDVYLSKEIGEYWEKTITNGKGLYYSANTHKEKYIYNGIGVIDYWDVEKIENLKNAAAYLTKEDQNIIANGWKDSSGKAIRTFNMGRYKKKNSNRGRPRQYNVDSNSNNSISI